MNRRGIAMVMAVVLVGLTGVFLTVLVSRATLQQRRTLGTLDDTQAAALLHAGVQSAIATIGSPRDGDVPTPVGRVTLTWSGGEAHRACAVEVSAGAARRGTTVTFDGTAAVGTFN